MSHGQDERRRYPRSKSGFAGVKQKDESGVLTHVDNISANGVLCHTSADVPIMTKMAILLQLPHTQQEIHCEGVVVRCDREDGDNESYKVAILYTKLSDDDHEAIVDYVEHDLAEQSASH